MQTNDRAIVLGLPLDNLLQQDFFQTLLECIQASPKKPGSSAYVALVSSEYLLMGSSSERGHPLPEVFEVLHRAMLSLCYSPFLSLLAYQLEGHPFHCLPLKKLLNPLCAFLERQGVSLFLLGHGQCDLIGCRSALTTTFPRLKLCGEAMATIGFEGEELLYLDQQDELILEEIAKANPDLLLLNLGAIRQEQWYARVRHRLRVPVVIGVHREVERLVGNLSSEPSWLEKMGFGEIYRQFCPADSLCRYYFPGYFKLAWDLIPLLHVHLNGWIGQRLHLSSRLFEQRKLSTLLYLGATHTLAFLRLPSSVELTHSFAFGEMIRQLMSQDQLIVDFEGVRKITCRSIAFLLALWQRGWDEGKPVIGIGLSKKMRKYLQLQRCWQWLSSRQIAGIAQLFEQLALSWSDQLYEAIEQQRDRLELSFLGRLANDCDYEPLLWRYERMARGKLCQIDLRYCLHIEQRGWAFLLELQQQLKRAKSPLVLKGVSKPIYSQMSFYRLQGAFTLVQPLMATEVPGQ